MPEGEWTVRDNADRHGLGQLKFTIMRDDGEVGATCFDYGLACVIEAALNLRDGTTP